MTVALVNVYQMHRMLPGSVSMSHCCGCCFINEKCDGFKLSEHKWSNNQETKTGSQNPGLTPWIPK